MKVLNWSGHIRHKLIGRWVKWFNAPGRLDTILGIASAATQEESGRVLVHLRDYCLWVPADECTVWK